MDAAALWDRTMSRLWAIGVSHYGAGRIFGSGGADRGEERWNARAVTPHRSCGNRRPPERADGAIGGAIRTRGERPSLLSLCSVRRPAGPASSPSFSGLLSRLPRATARLALAALLLAGGTLGIAAPAAADVLVSNLGQTDSGTADLQSNDSAQAFTTGDHEEDYELTSVEVEFGSVAAAATYAVGIWSSDEEVDDAEDSDTIHEPDTLLGALTCPTLTVSTSDAVYECTTTGIELEKDTTYLFVIDSDNTSANTVRLTTSDSEDSGAESGWSIANVSIGRPRLSTSGWNASRTSSSLKIRINGSVIDTAVPTVTGAEVTAAAPKELVLTFDEALDTDSVPAASAFAVKIDGSAGPTVSSVAIDGDDATKLTLGLSVTLTDDDENVTVDYTKPASNPLQDAAENEVATFTGQEVTNNAPACPSGQPSGAFWEACLTVGGTSGTNLGFFGSTGALSDTTFTYDGNDYTIDELASTQSQRSIALSLTSDPRPGSQEWILRIGGVDLPIDHPAASYNHILATYRFSGAHLQSFGFGTVPLWRAGDKISVSLWRNQVPTLANAVPDQAAIVGEPFSFQLPANTFSDPEGHALAWASARAGDGQALPAWLTFDEATGTFTGTPASGDVGTLSVTVNVTDTYAGDASDTFDIVVRAPVGLSFSASSVAVGEGSEATYTVALAEAPSAEVTVTVESDDTGAATVAPASLTFTTENWNEAQTVTVTGVEDTDLSDESVTLTHSGTGVTTATLEVSVGDDDTSFTGALVSNLGRTTTGGVIHNGDKHAQGFTTGDTAVTLSSVQWNVSIARTGFDSSDLTVKIASSSSGNPGSTVATLTTPSFTSEGTKSFTAPPNTTLAANTDYFVVIEYPDANELGLGRTASNGEDSGKLTGWSIGNSAHVRNAGSWTTHAHSLRIAIHGTTKSTTTTTGGVWSATLTVKNLANAAKGCSNNVIDARCDSSSILTDDDFTFDGTTYAIPVLLVRNSGNDLEIEFNKDLATEAEMLELNVVDEAFAFEDADTKSSRKRVWESSGLSWSTGDTVEVSLAAPPNAAPTASDGRVETPDDDEDYTFEASDFGFSDTDTDDALSSVKVLTLPGSGKGSLKLDGTAIASSDLPKTVTKAELDADKLVYDPPGDAVGAGFATFNFKVNDGRDDSASSYTMTIDVTSGDTTAPTVSAAQVTAAAPKELVITFDEALDTASVPAASAFAVKVDGSAGPAVSSVAIDGDDATMLKLGLGVTLTDDDSNVTVDYTKPASNPLRDTAQNEVATFTGQSVTNNAPACPGGQPSGAFWTACLTVGEESRTRFRGFRDLATDVGSLSSATFSVGGTTYAIDLFVEDGSNLHLSFTADPRTASESWTLQVGSSSYRLDAKSAYDTTRHTYRWSSSDFTWDRFNVGDKVSVSLRAADTVPTVSAAQVTEEAPKELVLTFSEALDTGSVPATSAFAVKIDGSAGPGVSSVAIDSNDATKLKLGLAYMLTDDDSNVTLDYTKPASNPLKDTDNNEVGTFTGRAVTNNAPACPGSQPSGAFWTACLTVGRTSGGGVNFYGFAGSAGSLSPGAFTRNNTDYTIDVLSSTDAAGTPLSLSFTADPRPASESWIFQVGSRSYRLDARSDYGASKHTYGWSNPGFTWTDANIGDKVSVSLRPKSGSDVTAPALRSATIDGAKLVLTFDEALHDEAETIAASAFTVKVNGTAVSLADTANADPVTHYGARVTLTLATAPADGDTVTVTYTRPASGDVIRDLSGNRAASFTDREVARLDYTVNVRALQSRVSEGVGEAGFEISISPVPRDHHEVFFVHWWTVPGTARVSWDSPTGTDYTGTGGSYPLGGVHPNKPTHTVWVRISDDGFSEEEETFGLRVALGASPKQPDIVSPINAPDWVKALHVGVGTAEAQVTIVDNDSGPSVTLRSPGGALGGELFEGNHEDFAFAVWLLSPEPVDSEVTVDYAVRALADGEWDHFPRATAGVDFTTKTGTLTFAPGETYKTVALDVPRTPELESNEYFAVALSNPSANLNIVDSVAPWKIFDNPGPYKTRIRVRSGEPPESDGGGCPMNLAVEFRDGNGDRAVVAALAASDFAVENGRVGTPVVDSNGLRWTVPAWSAPDFTGRMRVRLVAKAPSREGNVTTWEEAELVSRVAGDSDCAAVAPNALGLLALDGLALDPAFDAATRTYTASAPEDAQRVTVTAEAVYATAALGIAPEDADEETDGHQVALGEGETEVTVTVTPGDGSAAQSYTVTVTRGADEGAPEVAATRVPAGWGLVPAGVAPGERFRLLAVTSTKRHAKPKGTLYYNRHVQTAVASGHADIRGHGAAFRMLGCTRDVDARTNTETAWTSANRGVPVYWLGGDKVADDYADLYDGSWDSNAATDESGAPSSHSKVFTGCNGDGTTGEALGAQWVDVGYPGTSARELHHGGRTLRSLLRPLYALSPVRRTR